MTDKKTFAVFGASGLQGGAVVAYFLKHPTLSSQFDVRAITRNIEHGKSNCIFPAEDVTWVQADLSKTQTVIDAVRGADIVFGLNNFWEHCDYDLDIAHGKAIIDACIVTGVDQLIWSSQYAAEQTTKGHLKFAPETDAKAAVSKYLEEVKHTGGKNGKGLVTTHVIPTFYFQNMSKFLLWPSENGGLSWRMSWDIDAMLPFLDCEHDMGAYVAAVVLSDPKDVDGKFLHVGSEWTTPRTMIEQFEQMTGQKIHFQQIDRFTFAEQLPPSEGVRKWLPLLFETIGVYTEWGPDSKSVQHEHDEILSVLPDSHQKSSWRRYVESGTFMKEYTTRMDAFSKTWTARSSPESPAV